MKTQDFQFLDEVGNGIIMGLHGDVKLFERRKTYFKLVMYKLKQEYPMQF